jgi:hypothetical protein
MDSKTYQILRTNSDLGRGRRMEGGAPDLAGRILRAAAGGAAHQTQGHEALGTEVTSADEQMSWNRVTRSLYRKSSDQLMS